MKNVSRTSPAQGERPLPIEALVELIVSNGLKTRLICTPDNVPDLVTGWLFTQRLIASADDIRSMQVCDAGVRVLVQISESSNAAPPVNLLTSSGCSGGQVRDALYTGAVEVVQSTCTLDIKWLQAAISKMYIRARADRDLSGLHCAALVSANVEVIAVRCDVGRHNAVDKVIGAALARRSQFNQAALITSGRISSDMVLKAAIVGIPVLATERSVTTLAAEYAEKSGIGVVGRIHQPRPVVVGARHRIGVDTPRD